MFETNDVQRAVFLSAQAAMNNNKKWMKVYVAADKARPTINFNVIVIHDKWTNSVILNEIYTSWYYCN